MKEIAELLGKHCITLDFVETPHDKSELSLFVSSMSAMPFDIVEMLKKEYGGKSGMISTKNTYEDINDNIVVEIILLPVVEEIGEDE